MMIRQKAILVGPFIGCFQWELYHFAPYILKLAQQEPSKVFVIFTRPENFDLYGKYADILLPLYLDKNYNEENGFLYPLDMGIYSDLCLKFEKRYKERYNVISVIRPDVNEWLHKVNWQFSRNYVNYDFQPRKKNKEVIKNNIQGNNFILTDQQNLDIKGKVVNLRELYIKLKGIEGYGKTFTFIGCVIEILKRSKLFIGSFNSLYNLPLLLNVPTIISDEITGDELSLLNPLNTKVIRTANLNKGYEFYENYI